MNYQLVIQFPLSDASADDFDQFLVIENKLDLALRNKHQVDGHDIGSGEMNIFIHTNDPKDVFIISKNTLSKKYLEIVTVAFRELNNDKYSVLWPEDFDGEFTIK
jgi:hypothetical protein